MRVWDLGLRAQGSGLRDYLSGFSVVSCLGLRGLQKDSIAWSVGLRIYRIPGGKAWEPEIGLALDLSGTFKQGKFPCRPMMTKLPPIQGLNIRIPVIISMKRTLNPKR